MTDSTPTHFATTSGTNKDEEGYSNFDNVARGNYGTDTINEASTGQEGGATTTAPRRTSVINGQETDYETAQAASLANLEQRRKSSLSSTPGPMGATTTDDIIREGGSSSDVPPSSSVGTQNAPGKAGEIGEKVMGAFGYGGSQVQRAPEDQGLGEKIMNFLGA